MIDIIMPVYNTPIDDLKRCLSCIERQTFKDYKVYIIDDGSFDEVRIFLDEYAKDKENCIVKHVVNGGVSRARNIGIDSSSAEYLTFVDSDDTLEENFLEEAFSLIKDNDLDLVIGGYNEVKNGEVVKVRKCDDGFYIYDKSNLDLVMDKLLSGKLREDNKNIGSLPTGRIYTRLYKRSVLGDLRFNSSLGMSEDTLFMIDFMDRVGRIGLSSSVWYNYYINDYSISRRKVSDKVINDHMMFIEEVYKRMLVEDDLRIKNAYIFRVFKSLINLVDLIKSSDYSDSTLDKVLHNSMFSCLKDLDISSYINVSDKEVEFLNNYIALYVV
ncbi:glycosyltransferase family 2 [Mycoplasma sp. CAG:877]|nr:glycosyltransferase family 2 [Mycoplasma sp. CAG:877]